MVSPTTPTTPQAAARQLVLRLTGRQAPAPMLRLVGGVALGGEGVPLARPAADPAADDRERRRQIIDALHAGRIGLGEFEVRAPDGSLLHLECPARLKLQPDGRDEEASRWLAVATRYRLMMQIDLAGIDLALAACGRDGQPRCVHVAAESLATAGFACAVRSRLELDPDNAARLWIEIAEPSLKGLPPGVRNAGTAWRRCGARVGIEHAGSDLHHWLRGGELDVDYVKVSSTLVQGLAAKPVQRDEVCRLVALVHGLGARVIAEGADDAADLAVLWELGFDGATGQAARAVPAVAQVQAMSPA